MIPASIRRKLGLKDGESDLLLDIDETPIRATTRAQALVRVQALTAQYGKSDELWSEELIAERQREAAKELGE